MMMLLLLMVDFLNISGKIDEDDDDIDECDVEDDEEE